MECGGDGNVIKGGGGGGGGSEKTTGVLGYIKHLTPRQKMVIFHHSSSSSSPSISKTAKKRTLRQRSRAARGQSRKALAGKS
jgi:hypothetical protein